MIKNIVILGDCKWNKNPWAGSIISKIYGLKNVMVAYNVFGDVAEKHNIKLYKSCFCWYKNKKFTKGWVYEKGKWKCAYDISPDFIFDKISSDSDTIKIKKQFSRQEKILNTWFIEKLCSDKWKTYKLFPHLVPKGYLVNGMAEVKKAIKKIKSDKVVIKPRYGSSAKGLYIIDKREIVPKVKGEYIVQEFIDSSRGLDGICKGICDVRVVMVNSVVNHVFTRIAKCGLISNVSCGGKIKFLKFDKIPISAKKIVKLVNSKLKKHQPNVYTADFIIDKNNRAWLIELESKPGVIDYELYNGNKQRENFYNSIIQSIK
jgi:glutathione synthase/RimK-type ligase-like ATP-grasp enzyme